jgi:hypothetical protein
MDAITLLPAPIDPTSQLGSPSRSTSLVPVTRVPTAIRSTARDGSAYPGDQVVWTVSVGDDGSFNFDGIPRQNSGKSSSSQSQDSFSGQGSSTVWGMLQVQIGDVASQYAFYAAASPATGQYVNVYA